MCTKPASQLLLNVYERFSNSDPSGKFFVRVCITARSLFWICNWSNLSVGRCDVCFNTSIVFFNISPLLLSSLNSNLFANLEILSSTESSQSGISSFCLFLLQLSICIIYLIRENENNSSNKRNNRQIINADNVDETVAIAFTYHIDIVYLISSLSFVILTTVFLCQKWYFNRIIRNEKRKDLLFHPKKQVIYFPLYILCITCMLPSIAFCCLYHLLRILLYFIYI